MTDSFQINRLSAFLKTGMVAMCLSLMAQSLAYSQSAESFDEAPTNDSTAEGATPAMKNTPPGPVDFQPSRFAGQDIEPYTAARAAVFSMRNRATDPFGLPQDPNAKPIIRKVASNLPSKRQPALPPTPLSDIVKLIRVTTIMPGEKKFLVGTRSISQGDEFPLVYRGKKLPIKVLEVNSIRILFMNTESKEKAALEIGVLPPGMIAGGKHMTPPGMVTPTENSPLNLESDSSFDANN